MLTLEGDILGWENEEVKSTEVGVRMIWSDSFGFPGVLLKVVPSGHFCLCEGA